MVKPNRKRRPTQKAMTAPSATQDAASALFGMAATAAARSTGLDNRGVVSSSNRQTVGLAPTLSQFHNNNQPVVNPYLPENLKKKRQQEEQETLKPVAAEKKPATPQASEAKKPAGTPASVVKTRLAKTKEDLEEAMVDLKEEKKDVKRLRKERDEWKSDAKRYKKQRNDADRQLKETQRQYDDLLEDYRQLMKANTHTEQDAAYWRNHCQMLEQQQQHQYVPPATSLRTPITPRQQHGNATTYEQYLQFIQQQQQDDGGPPNVAGEA